MKFKITDNEDNSIKVEITFNVDTWDEVRLMMELLDDEIGI